MGNIEGLQESMKIENETTLKFKLGEGNYNELYGVSGTGKDLRSQVNAKGYDYDAMRAKGYTDEDIKSSLGL